MTYVMDCSVACCFQCLCYCPVELFNRFCHYTTMKICHTYETIGSRLSFTPSHLVCSKPLIYCVHELGIGTRKQYCKIFSWHRVMLEFLYINFISSESGRYNFVNLFMWVNHIHHYTDPVSRKPETLTWDCRPWENCQWHAFICVTCCISFL